MKKREMNGKRRDRDLYKNHKDTSKASMYINIVESSLNPLNMNLKKVIRN